MKTISVFVEGGGATQRSGQDRLRLGFDALLASQKESARRKRLRWQLGLYGSRNEAFKAFRDASQRVQGELAVLLVDAEAPVVEASSQGRWAHLMSHDGWKGEGLDPERIHLMTQCMESWLVADADVLEGFYGKGFRRGALPRRPCLDDESKVQLFAALEAATRETGKGRYAKVAHASELLRLVRPGVVASRCLSFQQLTRWLDAVIEAA